MPPKFLRTAPGENPVITEAEFKASPARLFKAWTEPSEIRGWFGGGPNKVVNAVIDLRVGGAWRFVFNDTPGAINALYGKYVEIVPDRRLVFTWIHERTTEDGAVVKTVPSQVTVELNPQGTGSRLTVRHEGIVLESGRLGVGEGWSYGLSRLIEMLEKQPLGVSGRIS